MLVDHFRAKKQIPDLVVASPDIGFGKQANRYAELMNAPVVFGNKARRSHDERAEVLDGAAIERGERQERPDLLDDFTISGGTLIEMANACKDRGAKDIYACVTHGIFAKGTTAKLARSPIKELVFTDTIGYRFEPLAPCCKVISVAGLFAEAILSIHSRESVSRLFESRNAPGARGRESGSPTIDPAGALPSTLEGKRGGHETSTTDPHPCSRRLTLGRDGELDAAAAFGPPGWSSRKAFLQDARFGLFVPWGVYSLLGKGAWVMERDRLPVSEYEKLPPRFNPAGFNAEEWVKTARGAGMKYLAVTAKDHDGFCMFDTALTRFDVVDATPFAKDPLKALADACRKHGVLPVVYYSLLDWHHPDYAPRGRTGKSAGRDDKGDWSKYLAYAQGQIRELCTNYGPIGGVWLDGTWDKPDAPWDLETTYALIHQLQPDALVANRHPARPRPGEDVQAFERDLGGQGQAAPDPALAWEVCRGGDSPTADRDLGSTDDLIRTIVGLAARGSNYLPGVAAKARRMIPRPPPPVAVGARLLAPIGTGESRSIGDRPARCWPQPWQVLLDQQSSRGRPAMNGLQRPLEAEGCEIRKPCDKATPRGLGQYSIKVNRQDMASLTRQQLRQEQVW